MRSLLVMQKTEFDLIGEELKKLFVFQGKKVSDEDLVVWVDEIIKANLPFGAVIQGIRKLQTEES